MGRFDSSPSTNDPGRFVLLQSDNDEDGGFLCIGANGVLSVRSKVDDHSCWTRTADGGFASAINPSFTVGAASTPREGPPMLGEQDASPVKLIHLNHAKSAGKLVAADGGVCATDVGGDYTAFGGPLELPSKYSRDMNETGYCIVDALIVPEILEFLAGVFAQVEAGREDALQARANPETGNFWMMDMMKETPAMTRMMANPVMLSLAREYFGREDMAFGHTPIVNVMKPVEQAPEQTPGGGWHSDFPYNGNMFDAGIALGIQCNICFDEFRKDNGATFFHLNPEGAHLYSCSHATVPSSSDYTSLFNKRRANGPGKSSGWVLNHPPHAEMNERFGKEPALDVSRVWFRRQCA